jgi:formiminotetrahydrofolate cyclodeaminase
MRDNRAAPAPTPLPWQKKEWGQYKETMEESGVVYHLTSEERAAVEIKKDSKAFMKSVSSGKKGKKDEKEVQLTASELANSLLPDRAKKEGRPRTMESRYGTF